METAFLALLFFLIPCLLLDYSALKSARQSGLISHPKENIFVNLFKNIFWIAFFEIGKIMTTGVIMLLSYALTIIVRGPLERHITTGGDGFLGGSSTGEYFNNTFGGIFSVVIPIGLLVLAVWFATRRMKLPEGLTISLCVYFLPAYLAYLWIMMWEW